MIAVSSAGSTPPHVAQQHLMAQQTTLAQQEVQLTRQLAEAATSAETMAGQLTGVGAERDKLAQEKLTLIQDNAVLRERALAAGKRANPSEKSRD